MLARLSGVTHFNAHHTPEDKKLKTQSNQKEVNFQRTINIPQPRLKKELKKCKYKELKILN